MGNSASNQFKVVLAGDKSVGKLSILSRIPVRSLYEEDPAANASHLIMTYIIVEDQKIPLQIWDTVITT